MDSNRAALDELMESRCRRLRGSSVQVHVAVDPQPALRVLLDPDNRPVTLRDVVAAMALGGLIARSRDGQTWPGDFARQAFDFANEFFVARQQDAAETAAALVPKRRSGRSHHRRA